MDISQKNWLLRSSWSVYNTRLEQGVDIHVNDLIRTRGLLSEFVRKSRILEMKMPTELQIVNPMVQINMTTLCGAPCDSKLGLTH